MQAIAFTEFRRNASSLLAEVERGRVPVKIVFDSSSFAKRFITEPGSEEVGKIRVPPPPVPSIQMRLHRLRHRDGNARHGSNLLHRRLADTLQRAEPLQQQLTPPRANAGNRVQN